MGGDGSGPKKGQPRRTKRQMAADKKREREEAEARRAANISRWNSYTGGQHAAQPAATAATVVVVDNHDDALEVAAADDSNTKAMLPQTRQATAPCLRPSESSTGECHRDTT